MNNEVQRSNEASSWGIRESNTLKKLTYNGKECEIITLKATKSFKNSPFRAQDVQDIAKFLIENKPILQNNRSIKVSFADGRNFEISIKGQKVTQVKTDSIMKRIGSKIRDAAVSIKEGIKAHSSHIGGNWLKNKQWAAADKGVDRAQKNLDNYKGNSYTKLVILEDKLELAKAKRMAATPGMDPKRARILVKEARANLREAIREHYTLKRNRYNYL